MVQDHPMPPKGSQAYRPLTMVGRVSACSELLDLLNALGERIDAEASDEVNVPILVQNWRDVHAWLGQAVAEAQAEIIMLNQEQGASHT